MQNLQSHLAGQHVDARGESWIVLRAEPFDTCTIVTLRGTGETNLGRTAEFITPFDRVIVARSSRRLRRVSRRTVLRAAMSTIARAHAWCEPWTAATAQIDLLPWQLEPAMAAVAGTTRVLLADGVGLGKTIQAALIFAELRARGLARRALVLTPASLLEQWAAELRDRFALDALVLDHAALARLASALPPDVNPWSVTELAISSIDLVKRGDIRRALDGVPLDVLIVDEAHHLRPGTDRGALVAELAARVPWVVFATATPHSGDEPAYSFLRSLGACDGIDDIATFRRSAVVAGRERARRLVFHAVHASEAERRLLDATLSYGKAIWAEHAALVAAVICRRAVSSPIALIRTLTRRRELLTAAVEPAAGPLQVELPWQEHDERDAIEADAVLACARLGNTRDEIAWLDRLMALADATRNHSSKVIAIQRLLARTREAAIVFSEYRDTLLFLHEHLSPHATLTVIHGGMSARERRDAVQQFVSGRARVLLATDAAGEGLNLQQRCRLVINVELPWSPLRLEQRIGRVDRLGQSRRVHAFQLVHRGSFEDHVLARFERRVRSAASGLDGGSYGDHEVAAAVFEGRDVVIDPGEAPRQAPSPAIADVVALRRRAVRPIDGGRPPAFPVYATPSAAGALAHAWIALFTCDVHDRAGRLIARDVLPVRLDFERPTVMRRDTSRTLACVVQSSPSVTRAIETTMRSHLEMTASAAAATATALTHRLQSIIRGLEQSKPVPIQASLFDKRAEQQARADEAAALDLCRHLRSRLESARALADVHASTPCLVALWPVASKR